MVRNVLALVFHAGHEWRDKKRPGLRLGGELAVHLLVLGELGLRESGSAGGSSLGHVSVDVVVVSRCCLSCVIGEWVEVDDGVPGHHVVELLCNIFRG